MTSEIAVTIRTSLGDIALQLFPSKAPASVSVFLAHLDAGLYRNTGFYRAARSDNEIFPEAPAQLIQGGIDFAGNSPLPRARHESETVTGLLPVAGSIALARDEPGTAGSEFFINMTDNHCMAVGGNRGDGKAVAVFGHVLSGLETTRAIQVLPTGTTDKAIPELARQQILTQTIPIIDIVRV